MSASTQKKNRQAARAAGTDKKTLAAQEEAKKRAKSRRNWTLGTIGVVLLIALILFLNSGFLYTHTTAATINGQSYSPAELNYYYANQYNAFVKQYGNYAGIFGLDTSSGLAGAAGQPCSLLEEGATWKDYFLQSAYAQIEQNQALVNYAKENGITLTDEELAEIDADFADMETYAKTMGFSSADNYLEANYGNGVDSDIVLSAARESALASKAYSQYQETLSYTDEELEEEYQSFEGIYDYFDYAYFSVEATKVTVEPETEGEEATEEVTEETLAAAKETADEIMAAYKEAEGEDVLQRLSDAANAVIAGQEATLSSRASGGSLGAYQEWLMGSRKAGDVSVIEDSDGEGYTVVAFISRDDNHYATARVRHILVKAEADEDGNYTDEAKAAAERRAEEILAEFNAGDKTEESFAALAEQYSEDEGSNTNGGLYENVPKGQMVEEFDAFCFEGHKKGDTAIVYGESSSYAGYHVMYYVGEGELYSNLIAENSLINEAMSEWMNAMLEGYEPSTGFWLRLVG